MKHEDFVTFEQAKKLKELGFKEECNHYYDLITEEFTENCAGDNDTDSFEPEGSAYYDHNSELGCVSAPTLAEVQKWLREKQKLFVTINTYFTGFVDGNFANPDYEYVIVDFRNNSGLRKCSSSSTPQKLFKTYEQALSAGIDNVLETIEEADSKTRDNEHIIGVYTTTGKYVGRETDDLESGIYLVKTTRSSYKIVVD